MNPTIDPAVFALLQEISRDPGSGLVKLSQQRLPAREAPVSENSSLLSRAERHLVREHREQVAFLLFKGCQQALLELPIWESMVSRKAIPGLEVVVPSEEWWEGELGFLSKCLDPEAARELGRSGLRSGRASSVAAAISLSSTSQALLPRDATRIWASFSFIAREDWKQGTALLHEVIDHYPTPLNESYARQAMACVHVERERPDLAMLEYKMAFDLAPFRPDLPLGWLHASLLAADEESALIAAGLMGECLQPILADHIAEYELLWRERRKRGTFRPSADSVRLASRLADDLPESVGRIANVFASN